ncbi:hypothetical protein [Cutibacterium sp.]|uniref:hypothetical protein n=1 Tax=Cutibacterium sp. TaxID=1912221 RepID=UPI0026DBDB9D|nr:hypothetical protein [Cutibacterium sp.]MDO4412592.1 hypothetical protein [Cutibacterium sp.]
MTTIRSRLNSHWVQLCTHSRATWHASLICAGCQPEELPTTLRDDDAAAVRALIAARSGADHISEFAGMALLQAVLPALTVMASKDRRASLDDYVSQAWLVIVSFPLTRSHKVCMNMALECLHVISAKRRSASKETPVKTVEISAPEMTESPGQMASGLLTAAEELGIITSTSAPVLRSVWVDALDSASAARRHHTSPEAVRAQCSRASRAMRTHRAELLAAA